MEGLCISASDLRTCLIAFYPQILDIARFKDILFLVQPQYFPFSMRWPMSDVQKDLTEMKKTIEALPPDQREKIVKGLTHIRRVVGDAKHVQSFAHVLGCTPCQDPIEPRLVSCRGCEDIFRSWFSPSRFGGLNQYGHLNSSNSRRAAEVELVLLCGHF